MSVEVVNYIPQRKYRDKKLNEKQIKFCEAYLAEGILGTAARMAGYSNPNRSGNDLLKCKRIQQYLAKRQANYVMVPVTYESKLSALDKLINTAIIDMDDTKPNIALIDRGLKAIEIANTMQGHNAPVQTQALTVNVKATQDKMLEARKQYDEY